MARLRLQSAGIEVFLAGENARILEPGLAPLRLQVAAEDAPDARAVLADKGMALAPDPASDREPDLKPDVDPVG